MLKKIRVILALICFVALTLLFCDFTGTMSHIFGWLPKVQLVPAILACHWIIVAAIVVVTLLLGRVYCSVICPLGVLQDIVIRLHTWLGGKRAANRFRYTSGRITTPLRIVMLLLFVGLILGGLTAIAALIEPYSAFGRMVMTFLAPGYEAVNNVLADESAAAGTYTFYEFSRHAVSICALIIAGATLLVVGCMAWFGGRVYCNSICPVGTVLGLLNRFALLKPVINTDKCVSCGKCARRCKASCIDAAGHRIDYTRCVDCMDCIGQCSVGAISYSRSPQRIAKTDSDNAVDTERRAFMVMATALAGAAAANAAEHRGDGVLADIVPKTEPQRITPIAPPGAVSLRHLAQHCTACQLCISKCPNGVLRPSMNLDNLMQPVVSYEAGYCRPECTACSDACPTGAIKPISRAQKSSIQIGHAVINHDACLSATNTDHCDNCAHHCPAGAIMMVAVSGQPDSDGPQVLMPVVNESMCIGCGACENLCPVSPVSAITVEGHEVHRYI